MIELAVRSCANVRDLGEYDTASGMTSAHRFVRCGGTRGLTHNDLAYLRSWGVTRVLDLRSIGESPELTCPLARESWVTWKNVPLYDYDISAPTMMPPEGMDSYLVSSYLHMLTSMSALRQIFGFFAEAEPSECVLFHCAAGMDRTGIVAMLLLGLAGVPRDQIVADYCYSFATCEVVDAAVARGSAGQGNEFGSFILQTRMDAIGAVLDAILGTYKTVPDYLLSCGIEQDTLDAARTHLCGTVR